MQVTCREPAEQRSTARYIDDIFAENSCGLVVNFAPAEPSNGDV